ncbi:hypothetical protein TeGR_g5059, partial [Tetraparma gracilis]
LNKLPFARDFIKNQSGAHASSYPDLTVTYVKGRKPELFVYDDGVQIEKVSLVDFQSVGAIHDLMKSKGFARAEPEAEEAGAAAAEL